MSCEEEPENNEWYNQVKVETWKDIEDLYENKYSGPVNDKFYWIFRGDKFKSRCPETHLDRAFDLYDVVIDSEERQKCEKGIIREFQRKASLYIQHEPDKDDILEWLSLLRHYGAPTRLMDWTYSFFIAVYFALAENTDGVVWALNAAKINKPESVINQIPKGQAGRFWELRHKLESKVDVLGIRNVGDKLKDLAIVCYLLDNPMSLVYAVNPFRLNERLTIQQGLFTISGDPTKTFRANLEGVLGAGDELRKNIDRIMLNVNGDERKTILRELKRRSISNAVLFPGLDGFSKSLGEQLAYPETFPKR